MNPGLVDLSRQSVLIVDRSDDSREVLRTILERRGTLIFEASGARQGLELARRHHPDVIVLDADADSAENESVRDGYDAQAAVDVRLVILGKLSCLADCVPKDRVLSKPYHYAALIRKIEELLDGQDAVSRAA